MLFIYNGNKNAFSGNFVLRLTAAAPYKTQSNLPKNKIRLTIDLQQNCKSKLWLCFFETEVYH